MLSMEFTAFINYAAMYFFRKAIDETTNLGKLHIKITPLHFVKFKLITANLTNYK